MPANNTGGGKDPRVKDILRDDILKGDLPRTMKREYRALKEFFLTDERRERLKQMRWFRAAIYTFGWLIQALFFKLTPLRRVLLLLALFISIFASNIEVNGTSYNLSLNLNFVTGLILLFILMLELKDKLVARDELEAGRAVQTSLMPKRMPEVPGWSIWLYTRTANEVGGDLVDFQELDSGNYRIALADVAGKGLRAALLTAKIQATLRALAPDYVTVAETGSKLNKIFYRDTTRSFFASMVYLNLRKENGAVQFINAGHLPPIVLRKDVIDETKKGEPAIGIFPEIAYTQNTVELNTGDTLVIYSDGLTEAKNEMGGFYGTERLMRLLPRMQSLTVQECGERIVGDVDFFVGEAPVADDLSLVIARRTV
ncbi:MAG TPA: PP2C family protein-serine/threonine phosphatase [Bacteroidota bacterium]|nr:PP2C family protein-serine/threonine phosphatase [Bacteroidota bacterium]